MKRLSISFSFMFLVLVALPIKAQDFNKHRVFNTRGNKALSAPSKASHQEIIKTFLKSKGRSQTAMDSLVIGSPSKSQRTGTTHYKASQKVKGLRVFGAYSKVAIDVQGRVTNVIDKLVNPDTQIKPASISSKKALNVVTATLFGNKTLKFYRQPTVERVAIPDSNDSLSQGFLVETWTDKDNTLHHTLVDGDGVVLGIQLRTNDDSYSVFTDNPDVTPQTAIAGPGAGNAESPIGWLNGSQTTVDIIGNNANAYLDASNNNNSDGGGLTVTNGIFNTTIDLNSQPTTTNNKSVAVQNLFYLNNIMHDKLYHHGFTESAGNFQENNFGNGGAGSDSVLAEAQDGSGTNNANFSTPSDGSNPRMQMYLFDGLGDHLVTINGNTYLAMGAEFGPVLNTTGLTAPVVVINDGVGATRDACESINNDLTGSIALIDRGNCDFVTKVSNAQAAGANGAIVVNNAGDGILTMGGTDAGISISSVFIGQSSGAILATAAGSNTQIASNPNPPIMKDGDFDSDIVYHEYGHGLTWRMIGNMSGAMSGAIGEGMGDVLSFMMNGRPTVGSYATSDSNGIRRESYEGYSLTYGNFTGNEVHDDGEIYAATIWNVRKTFLNNGIAIDSLWDYLIDGMNYTPSGPNMEEMRDGILQSANGSGHECLIWQGFAEFGIGEGAQAKTKGGGPFSGGKITITESFALPSFCSGGNTAPIATFSFNCIDLACNFDASSSSDDGTIISYDWSFGDTATDSGQTTSHIYAADGSYTVTVTVTDDGGLNDIASQFVTVAVASSGGGITLDATGRKFKGVHNIDLSWTGVTSTEVDVFRNESLLVTIGNNGSYTDNTGNKGGAVYNYYVCEAGTNSCSSTVQVVF